jgi:hypothetical protein
MVVHTFQDLAQLLDSEQTPSPNLSAVVLVATQPAPEKKAFNLPGCQFYRRIESKRHTALCIWRDHMLLNL